MIKRAISQSPTQEDIIKAFKTKGKKGKTITNSTSRSIVQFLNMRGFKAYQVYNGASYSVKAQSFIKSNNRTNGIPDIGGYRIKDAKALYVEVKTGKDLLSFEQASFLDDAQRAGCICLVIHTFDDFLDKIKKGNYIQ